MKKMFLSLLILLQPAIALAVPDEIYVDPAINANSGSGTIGSPYGDVQYALDSVNHGGDGANFNIKAGTSEVLASGGLTLATYFSTNGAPGPTEPFCIRGYTSAANDGGIAVFTGVANSAPFFTATTTSGADTDNVTFQDLDITTGQASGYAINIDNYVTIYNVKLTSPHGGIDVDAGVIDHCNLTYVDTNGILGSSGGAVAVRNSYFRQSSGTLVTAISNPSVAERNICDVQGATDANIPVISTSITGPGVVTKNTILANVSTGTATARGIAINGPSQTADNNIIQGFNSANDRAIIVSSASTGSMLANNKASGNTAFITDSGIGTIIIGDHVTQLASSGVTDASTGDYTPTADLIDAGWPSGFWQLSGNANYPTVGAITPEHSAGGGFSAGINNGPIR